MNNPLELPRWRRCPVCRTAAIDRLPACARCWTHVPLSQKRSLNRLLFDSPAYHLMLNDILDQLAARKAQAQ